MLTEKQELIRKYNVPGPRYTSYPTVPYWENSTFSEVKWKNSIAEIFTGGDEAISLYIHLPYCESLCTFCGCNTRITINHRVEESYIEALLSEWQLYLSLMKKRPVLKEIHLGGGTPTFFSPENLEKLISGLTQGATLPMNVELSFEGHPNNTTKEHLLSLYNQGFRRVSFGIQDFDPSVQKVINRIQSFEKVKKVTEEARMIGYTSINYDVVYGLPLQTLESMISTIAKVKMLKPDRIAFYSYAHVPWLKPGQRKFTELDLPDDELKRNLYETGREILEEGGYQEIGMDHFALKTDSLYTASISKTLHRNFMGYAASPTSRLIGLGVSAISDLWEAFAQNAKTVEAYQKSVMKGNIPVLKGHFLSSTDLILRQHILNIMCRFQTSWSNPQEQCEELFTGIQHLLSLENDGLVIIAHSSLTVTEKGRPFIRNICMALDARMQASVARETKFSKVI